MANSKKSNDGTAAKIIAIILALLLIVSTLFSVGYNLGWFEKTEDETENTEETSGGGATISEGESNGIKLTSATVKAGTGTAESTQTLTASVTPSYATEPTLSWSIAWDTTWAGYVAGDAESDDVCNQGWIDNIEAADISDYVSLSATTGSEITVSCWQAFGNPLIITCTTTDGTNLSATCKVDYQAYYTLINVGQSSTAAFSSSSTTKCNVKLYPWMSFGTIKPSGTLTYYIETNGGTELYRYISAYGRTDADAWAWDYNVNNNNEVTQSIDGDFNITVLSYSLNWYTFVQELIDGNDYITGNSIGCTYSDYGEQALIDYYNAINYYGRENFHPFTINVTLTDNKTGETLSEFLDITFSEDSLNNYPTFSATNLTLSNTSITF